MARGEVLRLHPPDWKGRMVACLASGPSLTAEDCEAVRAAGLPTIVCNTTYRRAPWASIVFGFDSAWWLHIDPDTRMPNHQHVSITCPQAQKLSMSEVLKRQDVVSVKGLPWFQGYPNTGACAISLAIASGAATIVLLGYDCQREGARTHWHPDHTGKMSNGKSMARWPALFDRVSRHARQQGAQVINCSRVSALQCFARAPLHTCIDVTPANAGAHSPAHLTTA